MEWFRNRQEAKSVIEQWRVHYDQVRLHSSLGNQTPAAFKVKLLPIQPGDILQK